MRKVYKVRSESRGDGIAGVVTPFPCVRARCAAATLSPFTHGITSAQMVDVLVLGATGFTGKLITRYLHVHRERDSFTFAIGGRSKTKLGELVADLNLAGDVQVFEVDVTKADQVDEVVRKAKVVINTIGPFFMWGKPVVRCVVDVESASVHCDSYSST